MIQNTPDSKPRFTDGQRKRLQGLGLIDAQIVELEGALLLCRVSLSPLPRLGDVRDELKALSDALKGARDVMSKLLRASPQTPARHEVLQRVMLADIDIRNEMDCIEKALDAVNVAHQAAQKVLDELKAKKQRRPHAANPFAVRRIEKALLDGFWKGHSKENPDEPLPPYTLKRSSSSASPYREIIGICFEAMGQKNIDPERAIKKHINKHKEREQAQREAMGIKAPRTRNRTSKKRKGQQRRRKSGTAGGMKI